MNPGLPLVMQRAKDDRGLRFLDAPTAYLEELRARHGDTFFVDLFGFPLLMSFAPRGLESLYQLP